MQINTRVMFMWKNIEAALLKGAIFQVFGGRNIIKSFGGEIVLRKKSLLFWTVSGFEPKIY